MDQKGKCPSSTVIRFYIIKPTTIPKPVINIALAPFIEIAPLLLEPPSPVDDGFEPEPDAVVVAFVAFACNCFPTSSALLRKTLKELLLPSAPGLIANTMPLPQ